MSDYSDDYSDGLTQNEQIDLLLDEIRENRYILAGEQTRVKKVQEILESMDDERVAKDLEVVKAYLAMTQERSQELREELNRVKMERATAGMIASMQQEAALEAVEAERRTGMLSVDDPDYTPDEPAVNELPIAGKDYKGSYAWINTKHFGTRKFYPELPEFLEYIGDDWKFPADFGSWCSIINDYCADNKYDNVVLGDNLTADEEEALRILLKETIKKCFRLDLDYSAKATQLFREFQAFASKHYTRAVKDDEWKKLRVDSELSDAMMYIEGVRMIKYVELCTQNKDEQVVDDAFLCKKLLETVPEEMKQEIMPTIPPEALDTDNLTVQIRINMYLEKKFPLFVQNPRKCSICESVCHAERSCPFREGATQ